MKVRFGKYLDWIWENHFLIFLAVMLSLFFAMSGGMNTKSHVIAALSPWICFIGIIWIFLISQKWNSPSNNWNLSVLTNLSLAVFFIMTLLSFFYSSTPNVGLNEIIRLGFGIMILILSIVRFYNLKKWRQLSWILTILGLLGVVIGTYSYLSFSFNRFAGFFISFGAFNGFYPNAWADFVILIFPAVFYLFVTEKARFAKILTGSVAVFLTASLILTYSRGGWISFAGLTVLMGIVLMFSKNVKKSVFKILIGSVILGILVTGVVIGINEIRFSNKFQVQSFVKKAALESREGKASVSERSQFFGASFKLIKEKPWLGHGPYSFKYVYPRYQQEMLSLSDHPHNLFLKIAVERGLIALSFFLIFGLMVLWRAVEIIRRKTGKERLIVGFILSSLIAITAHSMIDFNLNFLANSLIWWLWIGVIFGVSRVELINESKFSVKGVEAWLKPKSSGLISSFFGFLVLSLMTIGVHEAWYGLFLVDARMGEDSSVVSVIDESKSYFDRNYASKKEKGKKLWLQNESYKTSLNLWRKVDAPVELIRGYIVSGNYDEAISLAEQECPRHPFYSELWYYWGEALSLKGKHSDAYAKYSYAIKQNPLNDLRYYVGLYKSLYKMGNQKELKKINTRIDELLRQYLEKLRHNHQYTILTFNPQAAMELYRLKGDMAGAEELKKIFILEMDKLMKPDKYYDK